MIDTPDPANPATPPARGGRSAVPEARADRLAAALKANVARRKAQARARAGSEAGAPTPTDNNNNE